MTRPRVHHRVITWNAQRDRALDRVIGEVKHLAALADVLLLQETQQYARHLNLPGWQTIAVHGHERDETCILVRDHVNVGQHGIRTSTTSGWFTVRGGQTPPKRSAFAVLDGIEYHSLHTPPTVQTLLQHLRSPRRWRAYRQMVANISPGRFAVYGADWNLTPDSRYGRWLRNRLAHLELRRFAPNAGTHGRRTIDYAFARGVKVTGMHALAKLGSDHRPVRFDVTL